MGVTLGVPAGTLVGAPGDSISGNSCGGRTAYVSNRSGSGGRTTHESDCSCSSGRIAHEADRRGSAAAAQLIRICLGSYLGSVSTYSLFIVRT